MLKREKNIIFIDFETRSKADIKKVGSWVYSKDPSTEILCLAYSISERKKHINSSKVHIFINGDIKLWVPGKNEIPEELIKAIKKGAIVEAHNSFFEKSIWNNIAIPRHNLPEIKHWSCSAAKASYNSLPRSLDGAAKALNLEVQKDNIGKATMLQLTKPRRNGEFYDEHEYGKKYHTLYKYCIKDVETQRELSANLQPLISKEQKIWELDQIINQRGVTIDIFAVKSAIKILEDYKLKLDEETKEITDSKIGSVNQRAKILEFAKEQDEKLENYDKDYLSKTLPIIKNKKIKRLIEIRLETGKTSTAKYKSMLQSADKEDNKIRDTLLYCGASTTHRWSGKNCQMQNLPRGNVDNMEEAVSLIKSGDVNLIKSKYPDLMNFMSSALRGMIIASPGHQLIVADFASIEARVLAWLSKCDLAINQFKENRDLYKEMAGKIYNKDPKDITSTERQLGKAVILGCGYGMGTEKFQMVCNSMNLDIDENMARIAINTYRNNYKEIVKLWQDLEKTANQVAYKELSRKKAGRILIKKRDNDLCCYLPSRRTLTYKKTQIEKIETPWGEKRMQLTYMTSKLGKWIKTSTYGGKLTENITQSISRDIMADAMLRLEEAGYKIILTIHDEIIAEIPKDSDLHLNHFVELMATPPYWGKDIPIKAEGWVGNRYKK